MLPPSSSHVWTATAGVAFGTVSEAGVVEPPGIMERMISSQAEETTVNAAMAGFMGQ